MKYVMALLVLTTCSSSFAECWVVSNFSGYGSNSGDNYNLHQDGISNKKMILNIDGDNSSVSGSEGITFMEVTPQLIVGVYRSGGYKGVVESWGVDVEKRKVFYVQAKSGYTIFDGAKIFVGTLEGKCK